MQHGNFLVGNIWDLVSHQDRTQAHCMGAPSPSRLDHQEISVTAHFISFYPCSASLLLSLYSWDHLPKTTCTQVYVSGSTRVGQGSLSKVKAKLWGLPVGGEEQNPKVKAERDMPLQDPKSKWDLWGAEHNSPVHRPLQVTLFCIAFSCPKPSRPAWIR